MLILLRNQGQLEARIEQTVPAESDSVLKSFFAPFEAIKSINRVAVLGRFRPTEVSYSSTDVGSSHLNQEVLKKRRNHSDYQVREISCPSHFDE
jgi:hypothetical protein